MKTLWVIGLVAANLAGVVASNIGIRLSAWAPDWRGLLGWQAVGHLSGFLAVLAFTVLLRFVPLNVGHGLTAGLGFVLVQVVAARLVFHEPATPAQWLGVATVAVGIALIASGIKSS
ncbi:MAG TPA: hypothetical protein PLJ35_12695 [Anaerolineae bacterium]|nr:hypothetical protein [Anaerolineae bacterium]HOQ99670.1 hypothetical protein [Anaerolineae bacterium]HPL30726.1 hypothetical protein [Anaerolineae bacterium]